MVDHDSHDFARVGRDLRDRVTRLVRHPQLTSEDGCSCRLAEFVTGSMQYGHQRHGSIVDLGDGVCVMVCHEQMVTRSRNAHRRVESKLGTRGNSKRSARSCGHLGNRAAAVQDIQVCALCRHGERIGESRDDSDERTIGRINLGDCIADTVGNEQVSSVGSDSPWLVQSKGTACNRCDVSAGRRVYFGHGVPQLIGDKKVRTRHRRCYRCIEAVACRVLSNWGGWRAMELMGSLHSSDAEQRPHYEDRHNQRRYSDNVGGSIGQSHNLPWSSRHVFLSPNGNWVIPPPTRWRNQYA